MTGKPEVIGSSVALVPRNALTVSDCQTVPDLANHENPRLVLAVFDTRLYIRVRRIDKPV